MSDDSLLPPGNSSDEEEALDADDVGADAEEAAAASALAQALEGRSGTHRLPDAALETAALLRYSGPAAELSNARRAALREQVLASLPTASGRPPTPRGALWRWLGLGMPLAGAAAALWLVVGAFQRAAQPEATRFADSHASATSTEGAAAPAGDWGARDLAASEQAVSARTAPQPEAEARPSAPRAAAGNELRAPLAEPAASALASRITAAPGADSTAGPSSRAEGSRAEGSGAGLGALEAKRAAAPSSERFERSSQRYRARLLPKLGDPRVDRSYAALDRAQSETELQQAQTELTALSSGALGLANDSAVADQLRQDIFCRLAEVALRLGQPDVALDWAHRGLDLESPPNPFGARLWLVEGQARAALGDQNGAAKSYLKAIEVNERLLDESLDGSE